jgi:hypothetical protein
MPPGQKMKMDMEDRLPGIGIGVGDDPESRFRHPPFPSELRRNHVDMADQFPIFLRDVETVHNMFPRNQEEMMRRLGVEILDNNDAIIFKDRLRRYGSGDDLAEYAVIHGEVPRLRLVRSLYRT